MKAERLTIDIPDPVLEDLRNRLRKTRLAPDFANSDWRYGVSREYLHSFIAYWADEYDWRRTEAEINAFANWRVTLDDVPIHFLHERGRGPNPVPLILTHGWPWTFWDLHRLVGRLSDPAAHDGDPADAFDVIIPSLPGFGFSSPLSRPGIGVLETADLWVRLMRDVLGYDRFAAQGADFGASVTHHLGHKYSQHMIGVHLSRYFDMYDRAPMVSGAAPRLSSLAAAEEDYAPDEAGWGARKAAAHREHFAHWVVQASDPQTLAYAMHDSPAGMAAWILERRRNWSDCDGDVERVFSRDDLCALLTLYWVTETFVTSARYYWETFSKPRSPVHDRFPVIETPTAVCVFPKDFAALNPKAWAVRETNLKQWTVAPSGGHFGGAEKPDLLVDDLRTFFRTLR